MRYTELRILSRVVYVWFVVCLFITHYGPFTFVLQDLYLYKVYSQNKQVGNLMTLFYLPPKNASRRVFLTVLLHSLLSNSIHFYLFASEEMPKMKKSSRSLNNNFLLRFNSGVKMIFIFCLQIKNSSFQGARQLFSPHSNSPAVPRLRSDRYYWVPYTPYLPLSVTSFEIYRGLLLQTISS